MNDQPTHHVPLPVVRGADKVEQLRSQMARDNKSASPTARRPAVGDQTLIDRAIDGNLSSQQRAIRERVIDALRSVFDPEIPVNIYDLGLVYRIEISNENAVIIDMTLTAPGCPVAGELVAQVRQRVANVTEVTRVTVNLVWEPPWTKDRMSEAALLELGLL
jgi:FeS assembly SUF system protein